MAKNKTSKAKQLMESLLEEAVQSVKSAKSLVGEHAPDIAKEVVAEELVIQKYYLYQIVLGFILSFIPLSLGIWSLSKKLAFICEERYCDTSDYALGATLGLVLGVAGLVVTSMAAIEIKSRIEQLKIAPKKAVLSYLGSLIK